MPQTSVTCPKCSTDNPAEARFCMACGASMEVPCGQCETALPPGARFCFNCGQEIEEGATAEDVGQSAQAITSEIAQQLRELTAGAGERRTITMMFCDVKGSTATAERMDPEEWSDIMREAMDCFVGPVERYGGTVARLLGDAILAYFGAPVAHEDDPQRALLAALDILACSSDLSERVQTAHGTGFSVRVGINTGLVVVGAMGSERVTEYAALGDAANVAARMEQTAEPGTIRITEQTHRLVAPLFDFEAVGSIEVKGRTEPVTAYRVLRARGRPGQVRGVEGLTSPLVGRDDDLAAMRTAVDDVAAGAGRVVSLMGEAGLGKSRLVAELRAATDPETVQWFAGQCHSYDDATPYAPFVPVLQACLHVDPRDAPSDQTAAVIATFTELVGPDHRDQALYLCAVLDLPLEPADKRSLEFADPGTMRERVFAAVTALLAALARRRPVVLELEDLHWSDPTSIDLLEHLLALTDRTGLLLLLLFRPRRDEPSWGLHEAAARMGHRHVTVALQPLGTAHTEQLVGHLLRVEGLSDRVRQTILTKSEGNPFFVEEVIRSMLDAGIIVRESDRFVATQDVTDIDVPDTLAAVLTTRLDRLEPQARTIVQTAAVLGRQFTVDTLRLLADPAIDLDAVLADLQRRELLVEHGRDPDLTLAFKHALTRDTAYGTLLRSVRRDLHRIVGQVIEQTHPDRVFDLARHFTEADEPARAVPYLVEAGERAFAAFARQDAADLFRRALQMWDDAMDLGDARRAYEGLGNAQMFLGQMDDSIATFDEFLAFSREHDDDIGQVSALNKGGFVTLVGTGDAELAEAKMLQAKELADAGNHRVGVAEFHVGYCYLNVARGRLDQAEKFLGEAAVVCFDLDSHYRNFGLLHYADALLYQTKLDEAAVALDRAHQQAELDSDYEHMAGGLAGKGMLALYRGEPAVALDHASEGLELGRKYGANIEVVMAAWVAGTAAFQLGELGLAHEILHTCVEGAEATGLTGPGAASLTVLAMIAQLVHGPQSSEADRHLQHAREMNDTPLAQHAAGSTYAGLGVSLILRGDLDEAEQALDAAEATPAATSKLAHPEIVLCRGWIALARGNVDQAARHFQAAMELVDRSGMNLYRPRALAGLARAAAAGGDASAARSAVLQAEQDALQRQMRVDAMLIQRDAVNLLEGLGALDEAAAVRERLGDNIADLAARLVDLDVRRNFLRANAVGV